jgi:hypothetical protein
MGVFLCCECDNLSDSDDGCEECKKHPFGLVCMGCVLNTPEEEK